MNPLIPRRTLAAAAAASVLLLTAACGQDADAPATDEPSSAAESSDGEAPSGSYAAGDYSAEGSYVTPGGNQSVSVDMSLDDDGTITAVEVTPEASGGNSLLFQTKFAGGIADEVVGRNIDELSVSKVAGSSLTSGGFNAALAEIKGQAAD